MEEKEKMKIVIVGSVDHGKSTLIGRLMYDTNSVPDEILKEVNAACEELGKDMEFAYLLDSLEEERKQSVTVDTTQIFFKTPKRNYVIIDAPGHREFLKNMITGASLAETAILIVDVNEGIQEQTHRHAHILSLLGIRQVIVVLNKMDIVKYNQERFDTVKEDLLAYLGKLGIKPSYVIPISALKGDNIVKKSENMLWYESLTFLDALDMFEIKAKPTNKPFRLPVQDVYKFDEKRTVVGRVESGVIKQGDDIVFLPSDKKSRIKTIEVWNKDRAEAGAGESIGVTIDDHYFIDRGEVICSGELPRINDRINANIFWMSNKPGNAGENFTLKCATQEVNCELEKIKNKINSSTLEATDKDCNEIREAEVGNIVIKTEKPIVIENFNDIEGLGRFVLVRDNDTVSGGIIH